MYTALHCTALISPEFKPVHQIFSKFDQIWVDFLFMFAVKSFEIVYFLIPKVLCFFKHENVGRNIKENKPDWAHFQLVSLAFIYLVSAQSWFTEVLLDDGPSFFFLKVSKIFHKNANSFSVYIFLSLTNQKSKMREVISWLLCFWFELLEKSHY